MKIVLTSVSNHPPSYFDYCVQQIRYFNPDIEIVLLTDQLIFYNQWQKYGVEIKNAGGKWLESIIEASPHYGLKSPDGYEEKNWLWGTMSHIFLLCDYMEENNESIYHIESDVLLYTNLSDLYKYFRTLTQFACLRATANHISLAFTYIPNYEAIRGVCEYLLSELGRGEYRLIQEYKTTPTEMVLLSRYPNLFILPSCHTDPWNREFGIYDPASVGQFLAGRFGKENDEGWCENRHFLGAKFKSGEWTPIFQDWMPYLRDNQDGLMYKISSLHIHNKPRIERFMSCQHS